MRRGTVVPDLVRERERASERASPSTKAADANDARSASHWLARFCLSDDFHTFCKLSNRTSSFTSQKSFGCRGSLQWFRKVDLNLKYKHTCGWLAGWLAGLCGCAISRACFRKASAARTHTIPLVSSTSTSPRHVLHTPVGLSLLVLYFSLSAFACPSVPPMGLRSSE